MKGKDVAHKDAFKIENSTLKRKDRSKVIKLLSKIREKENIAEKLEKSSYNAEAILKTKITFKYPDEGIEKTCTLLYHAIFHENNQAFNDLLQEAIKQKLLKNVLNEEMIIKHSDGQEETHTILTCAILRENYMMIRKVLKVSEEHGICGDILEKKIRIKQADGQEISYTPLDYANKDSEIAKIFKEFTSSLPTIEHKPVPESYKNDSEKKLNATTIENKRVIEEATDNAIITESEDATAAIDSTESMLIEREDLQPIFESSEEVQNDSTTVEPTSVDRETNEQEPNSPDSPSSAEPHFDSRSGNTMDEKSSKKAIQPIVAGVVGAALLVSSIVAYILKMYAIAVVGGIVGLACVSFALYNIINPNTKLEKVKDVEQSAHPPFNANSGLKENRKGKKTG